MKNKYVIYIAAIITIALIVSAAFIYLDYYTPDKSKTASQQTISITDDEGYVTNLTSIPQRIVSLAPSCTQILFAVGAGSKVVGVTTYDDYPYNFSAWVAAGNMTYDGGYGTPNMEAIASLNPNLIVTDNINDGSNLASMRGLGYNVVVLNPTSIAGIYHDISLIGKATGTETQAAAVVENITNTINAITTKISDAHITTPMKVFYEVWGPPAGGFMTSGSTTWINSVITAAGGVNIFANETQQFPTVSSETIVALDPDAIFLPTEMGISPFYGSVAQLEATPGWNTISAVQNNRVYVIDGDLFAEAGPRVADCVYAVASDLYPQLFNSTS
jgi:iron complex transport system substrate-binding protein